jgi:DNA-binding transcriptional ArsR family regulator
MPKTKLERVTAAVSDPLYVKIYRFFRLLSVYNTLEFNQVWNILTGAGEGVTLKYLATVLNTPESNASKKLAPLRETGLVTFERHGKHKLITPDFDLCARIEKFVNVEQFTEAAVIIPPLAERLGALADPLRFSIWRELLKSERTGPELAESLDAWKSKVSASLIILSGAGWAEFIQNGLFKIYRGKTYAAFIFRLKSFDFGDSDDQADAGKETAADADYAAQPTAYDP